MRGHQGGGVPPPTLLLLPLLLLLLLPAAINAAVLTITRGPYLQAFGSQHVTIGWAMNYTDPVTVLYGLRGAAASSMTAIPAVTTNGANVTSGWMFFVDITPLTPVRGKEEGHLWGGLGERPCPTRMSVKCWFECKWPARLPTTPGAPLPSLHPALFCPRTPNMTTGSS